MRGNEHHRTSLLGELTAERDQRNLSRSFIETPEYRALIETQDASIVVGRRGTGKSSIFLKLAEFWGGQKNSHTISVAPDDFQTIAFRDFLAPYRDRYTLTRACARICWKYGLLMEVLSHLSKNYRCKNEFAADRRLTEALHKWGTEQRPFFDKLVSVLRRVPRAATPEGLVGGLPHDLDLPFLEQRCKELLEISRITVYLLLDKLDEGYENDDTGTGIIAGAISAVVDFNKAFTRVRPVLFVRDNINRSLAKKDPDYTRNVEGEVIRLHWDEYQLLHMATARMRDAFDLDVEQAQKIWDRCTANELKGKAGFKTCLQFTLFRPRDLLLLLNQAFFEAAKQARNVIVLDDVERAAKQISETRLEDLKKEYGPIFPSIQLINRIFANGSPQFSLEEGSALIKDRLAALDSSTEPQCLQDLLILGPDGFIRALYSVGFIGIKDTSSDAFSFCHDGRSPDKEFAASDGLLIHPCYWIGLNLSKNALSPDDAQEIHDEYDIKVTSENPKIRAAKLGTLIGAVGQIPEGADGAARFEQWCYEAVSRIFATHLSNFSLKPNASALQRRDIVATNLSLASSWIRINQDYGVRQVVFEVKNYSGIGREESRQIASYLTDKYGSLGFVITRDAEENLRQGVELDWVKEIYVTQRKLIIRISYKFLQRLLQKLRTVEKHDVVDKSLNGLLDTYERNYLSLQPSTTRRHRKVMQRASRE